MIGALRRPEDDRWYQLVLAALVLAAWAALALWGASPYAGLLRHHGIGEGSFPLPARAGLFLLGWTLMSAAMMLPGSLPLVNLFLRAVAGRSDPPRMLASLLAGYLGLWAGFGLLAALGDLAIHQLVDRFALEGAAARWLAPTILVAAGCCWTLMLLMFALGVGNLAWILALGAVMAAERATDWGRRITRPVGVALLVWGALLLLGWDVPGFA